ncbi:hypothetical protein [Rhodococcus sp. SGAir0479]|uniref:hypothetical protein n=1 Tax=Rhodococcus sp. SGAir0479 TaxID=2567884 RepID=UPI0010CCB3A2|nr:hypothetical protein [Rhodococcus sp. SGAir0479]QCQ93497.1 hypothetical protein E7742_21300 [Rhodococcus sp. SGAir0479]
MAQLSFFSAEAVPPAVTDLGGLLAAQGQVVSSREGARVSVVVDSVWRAEAIAEMMRETGLDAEIGRSEEDRPLVRTAAVPQLTTLAARWTRGAVKAVPEGWVPGTRAQRAWVLASGRVELDGQRYVLGLDPHAPDTHNVLAQSLMRAGVAPTIVGNRGPSPALRISGRRRLMHLAENIGEAPDDPDARRNWPHI